MRSLFRSTPIALLLALFLTSVFAGGCGRGASEESYKPQESVAKTALETALSAWKGGRAGPGRFEQTPALQVVDTEWEGGAKLSDFEIGTVEEFGASRKIQVKLKLAGGTAPVEVNYIVVGKDPLWVFRDKDYPGAAM
ncbi:MAG: hypothetical protein NT069_02155 [Planctomycetota bacterium]|nr:hypothetical protein [Planctomycetota bacterium]